MIYDFVRRENETLDECLLRLGSQKDSKEVRCTWDEIHDLLNNLFEADFDVSTYRKRYNRLKNALTINQPISTDMMLGDSIRGYLKEVEKKRIAMRVETSKQKKLLNNELLMETFFNDMKESIPKYAPAKVYRDASEEKHDKAMYALLSDIHYGLQFHSFYADYSPEIARDRVMKYAQEILKIQHLNKVDTLYVSLLGDMISGIIHLPIRLENSKNVVEQVVGVSELVADFLYELSKGFRNVVVNNVNGNHSRIDTNADNTLRGERLDDLIIWYCKAKLSMCDNVKFMDNTFDSSIALFNIFGKNYLSVHGDFDPNLPQSTARLSNFINEPIDVFIAGHMHIAESRMDHVAYIRNGAVVSGGDEYTTKKRLFGPAVQVCMVVSDKGIESIHPIKL